jgi:hypothetical protein
MLRKILTLLALGGTRTLESLALDLEVDRAEIEDIVARLCTFGYVEELTASMAASCIDSSSAACAGCSGSTLSCSQAPKGRIWSLTAKGMRALTRPS